MVHINYISVILKLQFVFFCQFRFSGLYKYYFVDYFHKIKIPNSFSKSLRTTITRGDLNNIFIFRNLWVRAVIWYNLYQVLSELPKSFDYTFQKHQEEFLFRRFPFPVFDISVFEDKVGIMIQNCRNVIALQGTKPKQFTSHIVIRISKLFQKVYVNRPKGPLFIPSKIT